MRHGAKLPPRRAAGRTAPPAKDARGAKAPPRGPPQRQAVGREEDVWMQQLEEQDALSDHNRWLEAQQVREKSPAEVEEPRRSSTVGALAVESVLAPEEDAHALKQADSTEAPQPLAEPVEGEEEKEGGVQAEAEPKPTPVAEAEEDMKLEFTEPRSPAPDAAAASTPVPCNPPEQETPATMKYPLGAAKFHLSAAPAATPPAKSPERPPQKAKAPESTAQSAPEASTEGQEAEEQTTKTTPTPQNTTVPMAEKSPQKGCSPKVTVTVTVPEPAAEAAQVQAGGEAKEAEKTTGEKGSDGEARTEPPAVEKPNAPAAEKPVTQEASTTNAMQLDERPAGSPVVQGANRESAAEPAPTKEPATTDPIAAPQAAEVEQAVVPTSKPATIRVVIRVRPESQKELCDARHRNIIEIQDDVVFLCPERTGMSHPGSRHRRSQTYRFDRVYDGSSTQAAVYSETVQPLLPPLFQGYCSSVFCYGATGAGKTFTMMGDVEGAMPGIVPQALAELFNTVEERHTRGERQCQLQVSYLEVYNERIRDLLTEEVKNLELRTESDGTSKVAGLKWVEVTRKEEVLNAVNTGNTRRVSGATGANDFSSRSHAIIQIRVKTRSTAPGTETVWECGKLTLVDLAGSERAAVATNTGRLTEGANINRSLLALGTVIKQLKTGAKFVNWRQSKLTRLLRDALGGDCRTVMITNVSPSYLTYDDSHNALSYASVARKITIDPRKNTSTVSAHVSQYKRIIAQSQRQIHELQRKVSDMTTRLARRPAGPSEVRGGGDCEQCRQRTVTETAESRLCSELMAISGKVVDTQRRQKQLDARKYTALNELRQARFAAARAQLLGKPTSDGAVGREVTVSSVLTADKALHAAELAKTVMGQCEAEDEAGRQRLKELEKPQAALRARIAMLPEAARHRIEARVMQLCAVKKKFVEQERWMSYSSAKRKELEMAQQESAFAGEQAEAIAEMLLTVVDQFGDHSAAASAAVEARRRLTLVRQLRRGVPGQCLGSELREPIRAEKEREAAAQEASKCEAEGNPAKRIRFAQPQQTPDKPAEDSTTVSKPETEQPKADVPAAENTTAEKEATPPQRKIKEATPPQRKIKEATPPPREAIGTPPPPPPRFTQCSSGASTARHSIRLDSVIAPRATPPQFGKQSPDKEEDSSQLPSYMRPTASTNARVHRDMNRDMKSGQATVERKRRRGTHATGAMKPPKKEKATGGVKRSSEGSDQEGAHDAKRARTEHTKS